MQARDVKASHGWLWVKQGFALFLKAPRQSLFISLLWTLLFGITMLGFRSVGPIVIVLLYPALLAAWMIAFQQIDLSGAANLGEVRRALKKHFGSLITLGLLVLIAQVAISIAVTLVVPLDPAVLDLAAKFPDVSEEEAKGVAANLLLFVLVQLLALLPVFAAIWFTPILLALGNLGIVAAVRWSIYACIADFGALTVYSAVCAIGLVVAGLLPLWLAIPSSVVLTPIIFGSIYASYKDIFVEDEVPVV
jgi:hypothetical protein